MQLFKDLYNTATVSATPYGLGELLVNVYGESATNAVMGEVLIQTLAHSTLGNFNTTINGVVNALYYLNARVESIRKTITTWDAYQIWGTLQDRDTILAQLAQLPANSSVVSNIAEPFEWVNGTQQFMIHKGDVLLKDNNENIVHIPSLSSGYYAPMTITRDGEGNNFIINYHYFTDTPEPDPDPGESRQEDTAYMTMPLTFSVEGEEDQGYSFLGVLAPGASINYNYVNNPRIEPVVKFFTEQGEQVFQQIQYTSNVKAHPIKIQLNKLLVATASVTYEYYIAANAVTKTTANNYFLINKLIFSRAIGLPRMITTSDSIVSDTQDLSFTLDGNNIKVSGADLAGKTTANTITYFQELSNDIMLSITLNNTPQNTTFTLRNETAIPLYYEVK